MAIITPPEAMLYAHVDHDEEYDLIVGLVDAAQAHIERLLGFRIEETYGGEDQDPVPEDLKLAVNLLAAWWFDNRTAADEARREVPFGVREIVNEHREFTF
ncbi:hypothetical protein Rumeso_04994 [Rubellimicrobium mesophilum DSM 19309]|uniref:Phage gp6-like head-tail connector protein n=1 Tax=Rubellimicrobium mesophilum DSM 19309 TaxID=442562 RepID=A0A017HBU7_9RHOB|nr:head-tail connector protein [Rubellimicrobium mesophilum]EYD71593.1 hypothetical protein Rumeso_04994 [Rubellimicrobium mesophilum DSM 19309]